MTTETPAHKNIYEALAAARAEFPTIGRNANGQVGTRSYKYADLNTVMDAVTPILRKHGLELIQAPQVGKLVTVLVQVDRQVHLGDGYGDTGLSCEIELPTEATSQALGSAITYARRYAAVALLGLVTEDDDDGAGATRPAAQTAPAATPEGWDSHEQAVAAHVAIGGRIGKLGDDARAACREFREREGWPLSTAKFAELETLVSAAEQFAS